MIKLCFLIGNLNNSGGTERVTSLIASELSFNGYDVSILSLVDGSNPFFELNAGIETYSLYSEKISFKKNYIGVILKIRQFVTQQKIDILIVVDSISCAFTVPALSGLKVNHICWEHFNFNSDLGKKGRRIARQLAARYCDSVITLTERDKEYWIKGTSHNSQITAISNPCPFPVQEYDKQENTKIILAVGRLTYQKGFDLLLESWTEVNKANPDWKLKIVGEGEDRASLTNFIKAKKLNDSVELIGNTDNVCQYYKQAEIFCLSSRFEGFPMVLLETLAFGLPVVSFDCDTGPAEILENTGSILVPQNDINQLVLSLIELMNDDKRRDIIRLKSKEKAKAYQPENIIDMWKCLLQEL